jgi:hypothetical protein
LTKTKKTISELVRMTKCRGSAAMAPTAGKKSKIDRTRKWLAAASGAAMVRAKREMTKRVAVSVRADRSWRAKTAWTLSFKALGKTRKTRRKSWTKVR